LQDTLWHDRKLKLKQYMKQQKIEAALLTSPSSIYYFTDFYSDPHERFLALYVEADTEVERLFVPQLDVQAAEEAGKVESIIPISDGDDPYQVLVAAIQSPQVLGLEKDAISAARYERLLEVLNQPRCVDIEDGIVALRMFKSEHEIAKVQYAVQLVGKVISHAIAVAAIGMSELELAAEIDYQMRRLGADRPAFESIVLTGARTALPHGRPGAAKLEEGHFLLIDIGVHADGYCSDITRTFVIGEATQEQRQIYETVLAANQAAISASKAGISFAELDRIARDIITEAEYGQWFTHRLGHGFGMEVHERPSVSAGNTELLRPGVLYTIEPGIYHPTIGGVRIEDDVYIAADGSAKVLTSYPKQLIQLQLGHH